MNAKDLYDLVREYNRKLERVMGRRDAERTEAGRKAWGSKVAAVAVERDAYEAELYERFGLKVR
jgi:hypothetical protein